MDIFKEIEQWKREHSDEWEQIERYLKLLEELGLKRGFEPEPLLPGSRYDIQIAKIGTIDIKI